MQKDYYLNDRSAAAYLEKDWFDHILATDSRSATFAFAPFEPLALYSDYHEHFAELISSSLGRLEVKPRTLLEIGSSLGRTFFEVCKRLKSVESATLVEPSQNLYKMFSEIFGRESTVRLGDIELNAGPIQHACAGVKVLSLNVPFQKLGRELGKFDLVICSNVIDQCSDPLQLAELLKTSSAEGAVVALSCTYQWSEKYVGNAPLDPVTNVKHLFGPEWTLLGETNLPFHLRVNERHWMTFLSHVVIFQRGSYVQNN